MGWWHACLPASGQRLLDATVVTICRQKLRVAWTCHIHNCPHDIVSFREVWNTTVSLIKIVWYATPCHSHLLRVLYTNMYFSSYNLEINSNNRGCCNSYLGITDTCHYDVIKWKHFPRHRPFVRGIHRSQGLLQTWINLNPAWISNHMLGKVWDEITYEVWEWISNFITDVITFPCWH